MEDNCTNHLAKDPSTFTYEPLQEGSFRLLQLLPGDEPEFISCKISHHSLDDAPAYTALSYTWGDTLNVHLVKVGSDVLFVRQNLFLALQELREQKRGFLWADALCINQSSDSERSSQVARMKDVFTGAEEVIAWLGPSTEVGKRAIQFISVFVEAKYAALKIERIYEERSPDLSSDSTSLASKDLKYIRVSHKPGNSFDSYGFDRHYEAWWSAVLQLHRQPYWTRVWIIQELACAKKATLHWGRTIPLDALFTFQAAWLDLSKFQGCPVNKSEVWDCVTLTLGFLVSRMRYQFQGSLDLSALIIHTIRCVSSEPRDRLFALLSIAENDAQVALKPDYSKSENRVYSDVVRYFLARKFGVRRDSELKGKLAAEVAKSHQPFEFLCGGETKSLKNIDGDDIMVESETARGRIETRPLEWIDVIALVSQLRE